MTQYDGDDPIAMNRDPSIIHAAEQLWADASAHLDTIIAYLHTIEPKIYRTAAGNSDASVLYDFLKGYIQMAESEAAQEGNPNPHSTTMLMCAAAITRLVRSDTHGTDTILSQYEKELHQDDDH